MQIDSHTKIPWLAVLAKDCRSPAVQLQCLGDQHGRNLRLHTVIEEFGNYSRSGTVKMVEPTQEILCVQRKSAIFESGVEGGHFVSRISDRDARAEQVRSENDASVREPKLRVLEPLAVGLALLGFFAVIEVGAQPGCQLFVVLEVTEAGAKLSGCRFPDQRCGNGVKPVIKLSRTHTECAQVISNHSDVIQLLGDVFPDAQMPDV